MRSSIVKKLGGIGAAVALVFGGALFSGASANAESSSTSTLTGQVSWAFRDTWNRYIASGGEAKLSEGATSSMTSGDTVYQFPIKSGLSGDTIPTTIPLEGAVNWVYPSHFLDVKLSNLSVANEAGQWKLKGNFSGMSRTGQNVSYTDAPLATLDEVSRSTDGGEFTSLNFAKVMPLAPITELLGYEDAMAPLTLSYKVVTNDASPTESSDSDSESNNSPETPVAPGTDTTNPGTSNDPDTGNGEDPATENADGSVTNELKPEDTTASSAGYAINGDLTWGIVDRWNTHVKPENISTAQGATKVESEPLAFRFPMAEGQTHASRTDEVIKFVGEVVYTYTMGGRVLFTMTISDPWYEIKDGVATLSANVVNSIKPAEAGRVTLANLGVPSYEAAAPYHTLTYTHVLATQGTAATFGDREGYNEGSQISSAKLRFMKVETTSTTEPSAGSQPATPGTQPGATNNDVNSDAVANAQESFVAEVEYKAPQCTPDENLVRLTSGQLNWGIRDSFTNYIRTIAKGGWELGGGTKWTGSAFSFPAVGGLYNKATKEGTLYYGGSVHFTGHGGVLDLKVSSPSIAIKGSSVTIYATISSKDRNSGAMVNYGRVPVANATVTGITVTGTAISLTTSASRFNAAASNAFAGFYPAGETMSAASLSGSVTLASKCDPNTGERIYYNAFGKVSHKKLPNTGASEMGIAGLGIAFLLVGTAGLIVRRKRVHI